MVLGIALFCGGVAERDGTVAKVISTASELEKSAKDHRHACQGSTSSHHMLLYYAVETGLKALIAKNEKLNDSKEVMDFVEGRTVGKANKGSNLGHRLDVLCDCAKLDATEKGTMPAQTFQVRGNDHFVHQMHEVWRYGGAVDPPDYPIQMHQWLKHLLGVIKESSPNER